MKLYEGSIFLPKRYPGKYLNSKCLMFCMQFRSVVSWFSITCVYDGAAQKNFEDSCVTIVSPQLSSYRQCSLVPKRVDLRSILTIL